MRLRLAHNVLGRRLIRFGDRVVSRIPVISAIYTDAREVTRAFSGDRTKNFRRVVLVPFAHAEAFVVAFVTAEFDADGPLGRERMVAVFMPTTPNPTTGFYLVYPSRLVRNSSLSIEEAVKIVISGGLPVIRDAACLAPACTWRCPTGAIAWVEGRQFAAEAASEAQRG